MAHPLESARLKLERSAELIGELRAAYDARNTDPPRFTTEGTQEVGPDGMWWHVFRCTTVHQPPVRWGLIAGDALHNARSALDHLACRLVEHNDGTVTTRTSFPVWTQAPSNRYKRKRFDPCIDGMSPDHQEAVRRLQPYARPGTAEARMLSTLAELDNLDKHKIVVPQMAVLLGREIPAPEFQAQYAGQRIEYVWNAGALLGPGVEFLRWRPLGDHHSVHGVKTSVPARATYGDARTGLRELREIRDYCVGIVESFALDFT